jgi:peptide/nickel transport system permease protein
LQSLDSGDSLESGEARPRALALRRFSRNVPAVIGASLLLVLVLVALFADFLSPLDPMAISRERLEAPGNGHFMGTDELGRDVLSRVIHGTRVTLLVGVSAAALGLVIGTTVGAIAGYFGGVLDTIIMRISEMFQIMPNFFVAVLIVALFGSGIGRVIFVIAFLGWPIIARLARAEVLRLKEQQFVEAARAIGLGRFSIISKELVPNAIAPILVQGSLNVAAAILIEAGLGFLGLSDPDAITWGSMLQNAKKYVATAWWTSISPGVAISLAVLSFNAVGDGLNDMLNPQLRGK